MVVAPTTPEASSAPLASTASSDASASLDASSTATGNDTGNDTSAPARFRGCRADTDCVAVPRVGCCHNGRMEAVAASQKDAYSASFVCPEAHPVCPMFLIRDTREPRCDGTTGLCTLSAK